jgi:hypothetical protein
MRRSYSAFSTATMTSSLSELKKTISAWVSPLVHDGVSRLSAMRRGVV